MATIAKHGPGWRVQIRRKGHKPIVKTLRTKAEAERWARAQEARLDAGAVVVPSSTLTLGELIQAYRELREAARPIADTSNEHYMLNHLEKGLGELLAQSFAPQHLIAYARARRLEGAGPYTINMEVSKLGTVLRYAGVGLQVPDVVGQTRPQLAHFGLIGDGGKRTRRPAEDELRRIVEHLAQHYGQRYADAVGFAAFSAMRRGEVCALRWADIEQSLRIAKVARKHPRKGKTLERVPIIGEAWEILERQSREDERPFPVHPQTLSKYFKAACDALGIPDLHFHDLRHEGASALFEAGYTIEQVALVTGHKDWRNLQRYTNLKPESLHDIDPDTQRRRARRQSVARGRGKSEVKSQDQ
ncbi:MAG TPA: site-specific integrase [Burkholderiales bacterium]|nr:site-specific integrase [Burkholderiales bacterium]